MACLSNIREVKDLLGSLLLCQNSCSSDTSMRYIKLGEELDSVENLENLMQDMFSVERLNLDLNMKNFCDISSSGSDSINLSDVFSGSNRNISTCCSEESMNHGDSVVYKSIYSVDSATNNSDHCDSASGSDSNLSDNTVVLIRRVEREEVEIPVKYVVTYHFEFDTSESENDLSKDNLSEAQNNDASVNTTDNNIYYDDDDDFEGDFFSSDIDDIICDKFDAGSKNNLLDESYTPESNNLCQSKTTGLVDYDSTSGDEGSSECDTEDREDVDNDDYVDLYKLPCDRMVPEPQCKPKYTPSMRKGYIYYSSELRLYSGELNYEPMVPVPEKKMKFVKRLFKKVFPSNKYVLNRS